MAKSKPSAKKKTTKKKTTGKKKTAGRKKSTGSAATRGKSATRKKTATKKKKQSARSSSSSKRKTAGKSAKKKTTSKKKKSVGTKAGTKKSASSKKSTKKKSVTKKSGATGTKAGTSKKKEAASGKKKSGTKKRPSGSGTVRKRGRSVAEVASAAAADEQGYVFINGRRVRMISTQGRVIPKKSKPETREAEPQAPAETAAKPQKTHLSRKELNHYKKLLLIKRGELVGDLSAIEAEALRSNVGNISHMPIHMADIGSDTYDQDFMLGMAENERRQIREIDDALQRIEDRTYGVCQMTGNPIPKARLDAKPWAKYTIEAARIVESQSNQ